MKYAWLILLAYAAGLVLAWAMCRCAARCNLEDE